MERLACVFKSYDYADHNVVGILHIFIAGFIFDCIVLIYLNAATSLINVFISDKRYCSRSNIVSSMIQYFIFICIISFSCLVEWFFWDEFDSRLNFIAVDYLIYTQEVINNILESYNVIWLLSGVGTVSMLQFLLSAKFFYMSFSYHTIPH